jgi:Glutamate-1-semialdehyde aminotransferase
MSIILNDNYNKYLRATFSYGCNIKINGRWLLDTSMGCGTFILGHSFTTNKIIEELFKGSLYIVPNYTIDKCGELLKDTTGFNKFVFCNSGSEATLRAIRIARAYTGRDKIAFFEGCWHGTHDWNLALYSLGIPKEIKDLILLLPFTEEAFEIIRREKPALVMVEPIQSSLPVNRKEFLTELRKVTNDNGVVLCFDEVISGFRTAIGGASQYYGITPDLVCYGKIVGGGFPIGIVGGNEVMG